MRSSRTWHLLFLSALTSSCSDDATCGAPAESPTTLGFLIGTDQITYEQLGSLAGNDCPDPAAPANVVSQSITGVQSGGADGRLTICIPRPDLLAQGSRTLGNAISDADIRLIDVRAAAAGCTFRLASQMPITGTAGGSGVCDAGDDPAGYGFTIDAAFTLTRTCGANIDTVAVTFAGTAAIAHRAE